MKSKKTYLSFFNIKILYIFEGLIILLYIFSGNPLSVSNIDPSLCNYIKIQGMAVTLRSEMIVLCVISLYFLGLWRLLKSSMKQGGIIISNLIFISFVLSMKFFESQLTVGHYYGEISDKLADDYLVILILPTFWVIKAIFIVFQRIFSKKSN